MNIYFFFRARILIVFIVFLIVGIFASVSHTCVDEYLICTKKGLNAKFLLIMLTLNKMWSLEVLLILMVTLTR